MKKKVLILAPHQDDEISIGGAMIPFLQEQGFTPHVLFSTNGDYRTSGEIRMQEASHALAILGVKKENIHILGYGDTLNTPDHHHIFYSKENVVRSPAGHGETYGVEGFIDYAYLRRNVHSPYTRESYQKDLKEFLLDLRPDVIFCVDYDVHADHRMLSLSFDHVMGEILQREKNDFFPQVFKSLSYALSFYSYLDFWQDNIFSTRRPVPGKIETYDEDMVDQSLYTWGNRIRIPVPRQCISNTLSQNLIYCALKEHRSQWAALQAPRIINGDCVYWERRTDSLTYYADVRVSSGEGKYLRDFKLFDVEDIDSKKFLPRCYLWQPDSADLERAVLLSWKSPQHIELVRIWGNINGGGIDEISIRSSIGENISFGPLKNKGQKNDILLGCTDGIEWLEIRIRRTTGGNIGFSEVEVFSSVYSPTNIRPFIKCMIDNHFIYDYCVDKDVRQLTLSVYQYGVAEEVFFSVAKGQSHFEGDTLRIHSLDREILVSAYTRSGVCDHIKIRRLSMVSLLLLRGYRVIDRFWWYLNCKQHYAIKIYNRIKHIGGKETVKRIIQKLCC